MSRTPYAKVLFKQKQSQAYCLVPLNGDGFSLHGRLIRIDRQPLTVTRPGEMLILDNQSIEVVEIEFQDTELG